MSVFSDVALLTFVVLLLLLLIPVHTLVRAVIRYWTQNSRYSHIKATLDGVGPLPVTKAFDSGLRDVLEASVDRNEAGEIVLQPVIKAGSYVDGSHLLMVNDAEALKQLLDESLYPKLPLGYDAIKIMIGEGLVTSKGELWHRQRKLISPSFHFGQLKKMQATMAAEAEAMVAKVRSMPQGKDMNAMGFFSGVTMGVIVNTSFGGLLDPKVVSKLFRDMNQAFNVYFFLDYFLGRSLNNALPSPWTKNVVDNVNGLRTLIQGAMDTRKRQMEESRAAGEEHDAKDLLTSMLAARDVEGNGMDDNLLIDECVTFLFAGHDTTSNLLSFCMDVLVDRMDIQEKLQEEVDRVLPQRKAPDTNDLGKLIYCRQVLNETLRLRPPVPMLERLAPCDRQLKLSDGSEVLIPAGTTLWTMFRNAQLDPSQWGADSEEFRPERFGEDTHRHTYAFTPFSAGGRNCIGQKFAMNEAITLLASLMQHFTVHSKREKPTTWVFEGTMGPKDFACHFLPRN